MIQFHEEILLEKKILLEINKVRMPSGITLTEPIQAKLYLKIVDEVIGHYDEYAIKLESAFFNKDIYTIRNDKEKAKKKFYEFLNKFKNGQYLINTQIEFLNIKFDK